MYMLGNIVLSSSVPCFTLYLKEKQIILIQKRAIKRLLRNNTEKYFRLRGFPLLLKLTPEVVLFASLVGTLASVAVVLLTCVNTKLTVARRIWLLNLTFLFLEAGLISDSDCDIGEPIYIHTHNNQPQPCMSLVLT